MTVMIAIHAYMLPSIFTGQKRMGMFTSLLTPFFQRNLFFNLTKPPIKYQGHYQFLWSPMNTTYSSKITDGLYFMTTGFLH